MKKNFKVWLVAIATPLVFASPSFANGADFQNVSLQTADAMQAAQTEEVSHSVIQTFAAAETNAANQTAATTTTSTKDNPIVEVSNKTPTLVAPVVKDETKASKKHAVKNSQKLNLKAVIFDPNADFSAAASAENREMTTLEARENAVHEALHGEVRSYSQIKSSGGFLDKYLTIHPESGPFSELKLWGTYKGYFTDTWDRGNYKNTTYAPDSTYIVIDGKFKNPKWSFRTMWLFNKGKANHDFFNDCWGDQYITYNWSKQDYFQLGHFRVASGIEGSMGPTTLMFASRSQLARTYNNVRALGIKAAGSHKLFEYNLQLESAGRYFKDWFPGPEFSGLIGLKPLGLTNGKYGKLLVGGGIDAGNSDKSFTVGSAFLDYEYKRWKATVEYASADGSNGSTGFSKNRSEGLNATLSYMLTSRIQLLGRYDQFDPNKDKCNDLRKEYTAGINYYLRDQSIRLMLNYVYYTVANGAYGSRIVTAIQLIY
jgi:hypothetical protein